MESLHRKSRMTSMALVLIPVGIAINYVGKSLAQSVGLPLYLDSIGTILTAAIAGPWVGAIAGALTNVVYGLTVRPTAIPFGIVNGAVGIVAGYLAIYGWFNKVWKAALSGVLLAVIGSVISAPITVYLFGGITGSGSSAVTAYFLATGHKILSAVLRTEFLVSPLDKAISAVIAYFIIKSLPERFKVHFQA